MSYQLLSSGMNKNVNQTVYIVERAKQSLLEIAGLLLPLNYSSNNIFLQSCDNSETLPLRNKQLLHNLLRQACEIGSPNYCNCQ